MATESILVELHNRLFGITSKGNLRLEGGLLPDAASRLGPPRIVGTGIPSSVTISAAAGAANVSNVTFQVTDCDGVNIARAAILDIWLSDLSTGLALTATTASGGIAAGASGFVEGVGTTSKAIRAVTDATGKFILAITDTAKTTFYPVAVLSGQQVIVGTQLITANYG